MGKKGLVILFILLITRLSAQLPGYSYYKKLTTQEAQIAVGSTNLTNFPVLVRITDTDLRNTAFGGKLQNTNGYDIQFTAADKTTLLNFQIEKYVQNTGELVAWVKVPSVSATVNTDFYLFFGNGAIVTDPSATSTWDANYKGVWHFSNNSTTDATVNTYTLNTNLGTTFLSPSIIADGRELVETEYLSRPATAGLQIIGDLTLETWVNFSTFLTTRDENVLFSSGSILESNVSNYNYLFSIMGDVTNLYKFRLFWEHGAGVNDEVISTVAASSISSGWHHVAVTRKVATNAVDFYIDGAKLGATVSYVNDPNGGTTPTFYIGNDQTGLGNDLAAKLDESRVSNMVRIPEWLEATYATSIDNSTFVAYSTTSCNVTPPNSGTDQTICTDNCILTANTPTLGTGTWSLVTGSATITTPMNYSTTATNISMNSASFLWNISNGTCSIDGNRVIVYRDSLAPTITCPVTSTVFSNASCTYTLGDYSSSVTVGDNCGVGTLSITQNPLAGSIIGLGTQAITMTVIDASGNSNQCVFNFEVTKPALNTKIVSCGSSFVNETTIGNGNNGVGFSCIGFATNGEDRYYQLTVPAGNNKIQVTMQNMVDANDTHAEVLWLGNTCPGSLCLSATRYQKSTQKFLNGTNTMVYSAPGPGTYFLVIDAINDGITSYDIRFDCIKSGIEFDRFGSCVGDANNDGITPKINGSAASLSVQSCSSVTVCHDLNIANINGAEWLDSVSFKLGTCYTNITNAVPNGINNAFYQTGDWLAAVNTSSNEINWRFNHTASPSTVALSWGDGNQTNYNCLLGKPQKYSFCFNADIASTCTQNSDLDISIFVSDDGVGSAGNTTASSDIAISNFFTITNLAPTFTSCPSSFTINTTAGLCTATATWATPSATDNCSGLTVAQTTGLTSGSAFPKGNTVVTYTATDSVGLTATCVFTVTVRDNIPPTLIGCPSNFTVFTNPGLCTGTATWTAPTATDNCSGVVVNRTLGLPSGSAFPKGNNKITYTATDAAGNTVNCSFTVTVRDNIAPTIVGCPANFTVFTSPGLCTGTATWTPPTVTDNCTGSTITRTTSLASGSAFPIGNSVVTYTAIDAAGNVATSCNFTITVKDNILPTIVGCPVNFTVFTSPGLCTGTATWTAPTVTDNCTGSSITQSAGLVNGSAFPIGNSIITYTAIDAAGNVATSCDFTITVIDNITPTIVGCPSNFTVNVDAGLCTATATWIPPSVTDNCVGATITQSAGLTSGSTTFPLGNSVITYTAIDAYGNVASSCSFTVTVKDNIAPTIVGCPSNFTVFTNPGLCTGTATWTQPTVTDNCTGAVITLSTSLPSGSAFPKGNTVVTYTAVDGSGNVATSCSFTVTVKDNIVPTIVSCPASFTVFTSPGLCTRTATWTPPTVSDNCTGSTITQSAGLTSGSAFPKGNSVITYTAIDASGNVAASCTFTVTVRDNIAPTIVGCPASFTVFTTPGLCTGTATWTPPTVTDNCPGSTITLSTSLASGSAFPKGTSVVTYTAIDASGNVATSCNFTITVRDNISPTIVNCPSSFTINVNPGLCIGTATWSAPTVTDNCTGSAIAQTTGFPSGSSFPKGNTVVTYTATDGSGNVSTCVFTVTVKDNIVPTIVGCPASFTVFTSPGLCTGTATWTPPTITDNCSGSTITQTSGLVSGSAFPKGNTVVTYTATDASGNIATSCTFTITVIDNIAPTIIGCVSNFTVNVNPGLCTGTATWTAPTVSDNCTGSSIAQASGSVSGSVFPKGNSVITYTAVDAAGNTATCSFTITVKDNIVPTINGCPSSFTVNVSPGLCTRTATWTPPTATDNCTGVFINQTVGIPSGGSFPKGNNVITYQALDASGNLSSCSFTITVKDNIAPTIVGCPTSFTAFSNPGICSSAVSWAAPTVTDNCTGSTITQTAGFLNGSFFPKGNTVVSYTATDAAGNIAGGCSFTVTIKDNINPTIVNCPSSFTVNVNPGLCTGTASWTAPTATDNCTGATIAQTAGLANGSSFPIGNSIVTYTATDANGLTASCSFSVTVKDNIAPSITSPGNYTYSASTSLCSNSTVTLATPTTSDNCGVASVINNAPAIFSIGNTVVTWTVTDVNGLTATTNQTVTIIDNSPPSIVSAPNVTVNVDAGQCSSSIVLLGTPTTSDNCSVASVVNNAPSNYPLGNTIVTWTVTDGAGWYATSTQTVTVIDNIVPTILSPANVTVNVDAGQCSSSIVLLGTPTTSDNCSIVSLVNDGLTIYPFGSTIVTWTVTDGSGLMATSTQTVYVIDNVAPIITSPINQTVTADANQCGSSTIVLGVPTTSDNCTISSVSNNAPIVFPLGNTVVTWTVTDASGLTANSSQTITVIDNTAPSITSISNVTISVDVNQCTNSTYTIATPTASDNCTVVSVLSDAPTAYNLGNTIVTWTVTDGVGLTSFATQTITVIDNIVPSILSPANVTLTADVGLCSSSSVVLGTPTTSDNCSVVSVINNAPSVYPFGNTIVTWTVTDGSGLISTSNQTVNIVDNIAPSILSPANVTVTTDANQCSSAAVALGVPTTSDNCTISTVLNNAPSLFPLGITVITWTVTDAGGLTATSDQTITVIDNIAPSILSAPNVTITTDANQCTNATYVIAVPTTSDNCTVASVLSDAPTTYNLGNTIVTWTVTDGSGLTTNATQTVTLIDAILPTIISPSNVSVYTDMGQCSSSLVLLGTPTTSDNCSVASVVNNSPSIYLLGNTIVTWTVTDANGLVSTSTQTVVVMDSIKPSIISPSNVVVYNSLASCGAVVNNITPVSFSDNCSVASVIYQVSGSTNASGINDVSGTQFNFGISTIDYIVTDVYGNKDTASFSVEVKNTTPISNAGTNFTICENQQPLTLNANQAPSGILGKWTVTFGQGTFANVNIENTTVSNLQIGLNTLRWTVFSSPCDSAYSDIIVLVDGAPTNSSAGNNDTICENQLTYQLQGSTVITGSGLWTQIIGTSIIANNTNPTTTISNYSIGSNQYVWQTINGACVSNKDTVEVMVDQMPTIAFAGDNILVTVPTAILSANQPVVGHASWSIVNGFGTIGQINNPSSIVSELSYGVNTFNWTITNGKCPNSSDDVVVEYSGLEIPNAFSPNGDGINDNFEIIGIQFFDNAKLVVLNRWGGVVYENENYKNEFNGNNTSNEPLVDDTYFYVLEINKELKFNGYIIIKREK